MKDFQYTLTPLAVSLQTTQGTNFTPTKAYKNDAGWELNAFIETPVTLLAGETIKIHLGVKIWLGACLAEEEKEHEIGIAGMLMLRSSNKPLN